MQADFMFLKNSRHTQKKISISFFLSLTLKDQLMF